MDKSAPKIVSLFRASAERFGNEIPGFWDVLCHVL
jgi:hypothetical protein